MGMEPTGYDRNSHIRALGAAPPAAPGGVMTPAAHTPAGGVVAPAPTVPPPGRYGATRRAGPTAPAGPVPVGAPMAPADKEKAMRLAMDKLGAYRG